MSWLSPFCYLIRNHSKEEVPGVLPLTFFFIPCIYQWQQTNGNTGHRQYPLRTIRLVHALHTRALIICLLQIYYKPKVLERIYKCYSSLLCIEHQDASALGSAYELRPPCFSAIAFTGSRLVYVEYLQPLHQIFAIFLHLCVFMLFNNCTCTRQRWTFHLSRGTVIFVCFSFHAFSSDCLCNFLSRCIKHIDFSKNLYDTV